MLVFVDESGDTGLNIGQGASKYFGIFMVIFEDNDEALSCDQRINLLRRELRLSENYEFHFHKNSDKVRESFLRAVLPYQFFYYGVVIDKQKLFGEGFKNRESFYKYSCSLLFENAKEKLENATVVIDKSGRSLFKYQLASYLKKKINTKAGWKHIKKVKKYTPIYRIDENNFEVEIDDGGNPVLDEDFSKTITEFKKWAKSQEKMLRDLFLSDNEK